VTIIIVIASKNYIIYNATMLWYSNWRQ